MVPGPAGPAGPAPVLRSQGQAPQVLQVRHQAYTPAPALPYHAVHHAPYAVPGAAVPYAVYRGAALPGFVTNPAGLVPQRRRELVRQVGDAVQLSALGVVAVPVPTFQCKICLSNLPLPERVVFQECMTPDHGCCRDCTQNWIEERVKSGQVHSLLCRRRGNVECNARASDEEVLSLTDEETFAKYKRFMMMREDDLVRECPYCSHLSRPNVVAGEITAEMVCPACSQLFCYYHSNAHAGRPCDEYSRQISRQLKEMKSSGPLADAKQCPKCGLHTVKLSGCNHMTCAERSCGAHWCWICEEQIVGGNNGVMQHYSTGNCRQFPDVDDMTTPGCWLTFLRIFTFPFRIFFLILAALLIPLSVVLAPICLAATCCHYNICRKRRRRHAQSFMKAMVVFPACLIFVTFSILYSVVVGLAVLFIVQVFGCCVPNRLGEFDHTHIVWLWSLPFSSLEPLRPCMRWYLRHWSCGTCCDSELEEEEGAGADEEELDSD